MEVTVSERGQDGYVARIVTVQIPDACPQCGGPRGTPALRRYCEEGAFYYVDNWDNPCGHVDFYPAVLAEAKQIEMEGSM
ncbi:hypothetical protein [Chromobacterium haemolyticum]|uniref:hypothetical protein n=1 Tax=Chromobacterium haemolyticum TaxID=394935 RepID=UPI000DEF88E0|nr:hypothetical protein [Chromobacterium haemolyticum]